MTWIECLIDVTCLISIVVMIRAIGLTVFHILKKEG